MSDAPDDDAARLGYYRVLSDAVLFLWLEAEPDGDSLSPRVFDLEDGPVVLACDSEERLADLTTGPVPYAALPGRIVAQALAGQGVALGINLGVADSAYLVPPQALDWLAATLGHAPVAAEARPETFAPPLALPPGLLAGLQAKLADTAGLATGALLAAVTYAGGRRGHMLAFLGASPVAQPALARAVAEALTFSGIEAGEIDVAFLSAADPAALAMARVALRLDPGLPPPAVPQNPAPPRPPRLR
ncbi:MAG: SseB family protein [Gemmobacter sp.]